MSVRPEQLIADTIQDFTPVEKGYFRNRLIEFVEYHSPPDTDIENIMPILREILDVDYEKDPEEFKKKLFNQVLLFEEDNSEFACGVRGTDPYKLPISHFKIPRTIEDLNGMITDFYPLAEKLSAKASIDPVYTEDRFNLKSVYVSGWQYDCLIQSFLTATTTNFRRLSQSQKNVISYYFRRYICPYYYGVSPVTHTRYLEVRSTDPLRNPGRRLSDTTQYDTTYRSALERVNASALSAEDKELIRKAFEQQIEHDKNDWCIRDLVAECIFLNDIIYKKLAEVFQLTILIVTKVERQTFIAREGSGSKAIIIYNPNDGHFRAVKRTTDNQYLFNTSELNDYYERVSADLLQYGTQATVTDCQFNVGETVLHDGVRKQVVSQIWKDTADADGIMRCRALVLSNTSVIVPLAEVRKVTSGGRTRKRRSGR